MFGQIPDFTNGFEFLRRLWSAGGSLGGGMMPGMASMTPPMDLEEVDKRIHDLKAVEGWLQLNASLLRTTIQGLEVQRATLVALQTFGNALSPDAMQHAMENVARAANAPSAAPHHHWPPASTPAPETVSEAQADAENEEEDDFDAPPDNAPSDEGVTAEAAAGTDAEPGQPPVPPNAGLWWDLLQQQFNQIASSAAAASTAPFGSLAGFGAAAAPGAEGVEPGANPASTGNGSGSGSGNANGGGNGKASAPRQAASRKAAPKKAAAKKAAAKKAAPAKSAAKPAAKKSATKPAPKSATKSASRSASDAGTEAGTAPPLVDGKPGDVSG